MIDPMSNLYVRRYDGRYDGRLCLKVKGRVESIVPYSVVERWLKVWFGGGLEV